MTVGLAYLVRPVVPAQLDLRDTRPAIIRFLASKSLSLMLFGVPGLKRTLISLAALVAVSAAIVSCGSSSSPGNHTSGLTFRAFVSNPLFTSGTGSSPVINIVNAANDVLSPSTVGLTITQPGLMALSPDLKLTAVFSPSGNAVAVVDNTTESIYAVPSSTGSSSSVPAISLPGLTESMFIANDNATGYAAVPSAAVTGQSPGAVVVLSLLTGSLEATIPVAAAHYIVPSPDGNRILVFSDGSNSITVITTALIGSNGNPVSTICCFDRPVWAIFSSDSSTAYIFNCGPECGGMEAGISVLDVGAGSVEKTVPVSGATYGLLSGDTLYVAGSPPRTPCGSGTAAKTCGTLSILNASSMKVTAGPILITDGYHDRMAMGDNGQLFIGSHSCTSINVSGGEVRGCLSIFNTSARSVVVPPQTGDATGIQPIPGRDVVYVCEGGVFQIFDTTTDQLLVQTTRTVIVGHATDVKVVDPPPNPVPNPPQT